MLIGICEKIIFRKKTTLCVGLYRNKKKHYHKYKKGPTLGVGLYRNLDKLLSDDDLMTRLMRGSV